MITRYPGETDAELRARVFVIPIVKEARNAIWRVFGMRNKDTPRTVLWVGNQRIDIADIVINDIAANYTPIDVLGQYEPVEFSCSGFRVVDNKDK